MIPLHHTLPRHVTPIVNRGLIGVEVIFFLTQLLFPETGERMIYLFGYVPARLIDPQLFQYQDWEATLTLVSSLFLHGGLVHLVGNLIYLWVFGDAIEEAFGHSGFLLFFITCGAMGSISHTLIFPHSVIPSIGASGSIAGVLGAFLVLHPRARIATLFPLVVYWAIAEVRAALFLPVWFGMQFFNGALSIAAAAKTQEVAGVAWWAHVGGFLFGAIVAGAVRLVRKG